MLPTEQVEELISLITELDRETLIAQFGNFKGSFPVDFTREFLENQPLERLRHLFLALCLQQQRVPQVCSPEAA